MRELHGTRGIVFAVLGMLALSPGATAQESERRKVRLAELRQEQFDLFTSCAPVAYALRIQTDARDLTEEVQAFLAPTVSSRLRVARIHGGRVEDPGPPMRAILSVTVHTVSYSFHVSLQLRKALYDEASRQYGAAVTWQRSATGGNPERTHIMEAMVSMLDLFVDEYLRVNAGACK